MYLSTGPVVFNYFDFTGIVVRSYFMASVSYVGPFRLLSGKFQSVLSLHYTNYLLTIPVLSERILFRTVRHHSIPTKTVSLENILWNSHGNEFDMSSKFHKFPYWF